MREKRGMTGALSGRRLTTIFLQKQKRLYGRNGQAQISGTVVAVIAFTLVFEAGVFGMLKIGVGAVDRGQTEAALALGYGSTHTFFRIILVVTALLHRMASDFNLASSLL